MLRKRYMRAGRNFSTRGRSHANNWTKPKWHTFRLATSMMLPASTWNLFSSPGKKLRPGRRRRRWMRPEDTRKQPKRSCSTPKFTVPWTESLPTGRFTPARWPVPVRLCSRSWIFQALLREPAFPLARFRYLKVGNDATIARRARFSRNSRQGHGRQPRPRSQQHNCGSLGQRGESRGAPASGRNSPGFDHSGNNQGRPRNSRRGNPAFTGRRGRYGACRGPDSLAHERKIEPGIHEGDRVQVVKGLAQGEQVITVGGFGIQDKTKVKIEKPEAKI